MNHSLKRRHWKTPFQPTAAQSTFKEAEKNETLISLTRRREENTPKKLGEVVKIK